MPWFRSIFTRGRFEQILNFLHLVNNENTPPRESPEYKLYKLGSLPETLSKTYQDCYTPERELATDEKNGWHEMSYKYCSVHAKETKKVWCKTVGLM